LLCSRQLRLYVREVQLRAPGDDLRLERRLAEIETVEHVVGIARRLRFLVENQLAVALARWLTAAERHGLENPPHVRKMILVSVEQSPMRVCGREESRKAVWVETGFVLLACVVPLIFVSVAGGSQPQRPREGFLFTATYRTLQAAIAIATVLFVISRSVRSPRRFGLFRFRWRDVLYGLGLYVLCMVAYYVFWIAVSLIMKLLGTGGLRGPTLGGIATPQTAAEYAVLALLSLVNGAAEELVMRAYLLTRFEQLFRSTAVAILLSAALFAAYHSYQGYIGLVTVALIGLIYGTCFARWRRIWPLILAHALQDFVSIAMLAATR
jgi:membrane protease YdiL (CAAX protease family)